MIEFLEEPHIYLMDGVIVPSVSEILHYIFPNKYKGVNKAILNKKAEYGTAVHSAVELIEKPNKYFGDYKKVSEELNLNYIQVESLKQYLKLKEKNNIEVIEQEQMIAYEDKYAGRFDMIANVNGSLSLCDIKTTAELDKEYLSWQLSYYELAMVTQHKHIQNFDKLYAIWLPKKELGELVEIERKPKEELLQVLDEFLKSKGD